MANDDPQSDPWAPRRTTRAPEADDRFEVPIRGVDVGPETRCAHYHGSQDIVAIRFPCCKVFYPCFACHRQTTDHEARRWPADRVHTPAVLCGACQAVLTIQQYLDADHTCLSCGAAFNPNCARHYERYFEVR
ncbi:MAG: CHY zinc finger protein [Salinibacter sp.]